MKDISKIVGEGTPWSTESLFWNWLRGGLRRHIWKKHPVKLQHIVSNRFKASLGRKTKTNPLGLVWCCECSLCGEVFRQSDCEVDHIVPSGSLKEIKDIEKFVVNLAFISDKDLRILDKECHKLVTLSQRRGISLEEAREQQKIIQFKKLTANQQKETLKKLNIDVTKLKNETERVEVYATASRRR
jgi:5-methylcytosine-specific restriction endonuclease McrA